MSNVIALNPNDYLTVDNSEVHTTSLKVAEAFSKQHKHIIEKIKNLECSEEFNGSNFRPVEYLDNKGEKRPSYQMTKNGFMFLVMGFTGKKAAQIKEAYINAFDAMYEKLFPKKSLAAKTLTPAQQRHIQKRVGELVHSQVGTTHAKLYSQIKDKFKIGTYKDLPTSQYPELCHFLNCEPLEGEYIAANISDQINLSFEAYQEEGEDEKYALLNSMVKQMKLKADPVIISYVELMNFVSQIRALQHLNRAAILSGTKIDKHIQDLKNKTGRGLLDEF